ncbi:potassium/sodium hyperpolarization-activated cyclic nucleotide-gated channel 2 [Ciona intestinalis]
MSTTEWINEFAPNTSDTDSIGSQPEHIRRFSVAGLMKFPRKSINSIKERLSKRKGPSPKRQSISDTALLRAPNARTSRTTKVTSSLASTKSAVSVATRAVPFTKWSRKLYGSEKAVQDEHLRVIEAGGFIIHPFSNFRFTWDLLSALLIIANIIVIPMDLAFSGDRREVASMAFKLISDAWFLIDIILNFRTGISVIGTDSTIIELDPVKIRNRYLKGWFAIDFIASFPMDFILTFVIGQAPGRSHKAISLLRVGKGLSLIRVARIPRLIRGLHQWEEVFNLQYDMAVSLLRLAYLIFIIFLVCHWMGCLQYMVPMYYGFPEDTWVRMRGLDNPNITWWEAYSWSLFKSTSHMLCIGYSEVIPVGLIDLWMTMLSQIIGAILFAVFIGNAINLMEEMDASKNAYKMKLSQITEYLAFRRIPVKLRRKIMDYFDIRYTGRLFDEEKILNELSPGLRRDIIWHNCADLIHSVPLFEDVSDGFVEDLGTKMVFTVYTADAEVVSEGEKAFHMFFILRGELVIEASDGSFMREISDGMHFGETCLLNKELRRAASVKAATNVHMYTLHRHDYQQVALRHPDDKKRIDTRFAKLRERSSQYDFIQKCQSTFKI